MPASVQALRPVTGNSIATITPETGAIGTPVPIGSQPGALALSSDGQVLYTSLTGSNTVARFNMLTQQSDGAYSIASSNIYGTPTAPTAMAVQPGSETAVAFDQPSVEVFDFNTSTKVATARTITGSSYSSSSPQFLNALTLFANYSGSSVELYNVTPTGVTTGYQSPYMSSLNHFSAFTINDGLIFANAGAVADPRQIQ
jgi:trimeric autotransporter adhesin